MPKKSTPVRSGVQRTKPKTQKSFELVRPVSQVQEQEIEEASETVGEPMLVEAARKTSSTAESSSELAALPTVPQKKVEFNTALPTVPQKRAEPSRVTTEVAPVETVSQKKAKSSRIATEVVPIETVTPKVPEAVEVPLTEAKGSASARLAARKNAQRSQRSQAALITAEHYSYVRRDLAFIAILALIMFAAIIVLYFIPGIGI